MPKIVTLRLDPAKNGLQAHRADGSGRGALRKKLGRDQVPTFFCRLRPCIVAMEACGGAHFRGRAVARRARKDEVARRLMTIPGIGPLIATAIAVLATPPETFREARNFAAWLGLTPRQRSTGGKQRLGATKMGKRRCAGC